MQNRLPKPFSDQLLCQVIIPVAVWVADKKSLSVIWINRPHIEGIDFVHQTVIGQRVDTLLTIAPYQDREPHLEMAIRKGENRFRAYLTADPKYYRPGLTPYAITGFKVLVDSMVKNDHIILLIRPIASPLVKEYSQKTKDIIVRVDGEDNILEVSPNYLLAPVLKNIPLYNKSVTELVNQKDWAAIKKGRTNALRYIKMHDAGNKNEWKTAFQDTFKNLKHWIQDETTGMWSIKKGEGLHFKSKRTFSFLYLKKKLDLVNRDFAVTCNVKRENLDRISFLLNQQYPDKSDNTGYNIGISGNLKKPVVIFKKDTRFLLFNPFKKPKDGTYHFRIEKIGGILRFYVNNVLSAEYTDLSVIPNIHGCFGILVSGQCTITRFEIALKNSNFDYNKTLARPYRLSIRHIRDRIYDLSYITQAEWAPELDLPRVCEDMLFTDVTDIARVEQERDKINLKYNVLKKKNYYGFIGGNVKIQEIIESVDNFADTNATVLINGPTGTGKEVLARAIHRRSSRRDKALIKVDCASIPRTLLESELFGHEKGAFTGAVSSFRGRFEEADKGTLFLDEIGNIDLSIQAKLLGFLEDRSFTPIGSTQPVQVDTRIIAATNADLEDMIKQGLFRQDLYFRLRVLHLKLPPLKERLDDIPLLIDSFLDDINKQHQLNIKTISQPVLESFMSYDWPGNVRELFNILLNLAIQKKKGTLDRKPDLLNALKAPKNTRQYIPENERYKAILKYAGKKSYFAAKECCQVLPVSIHTIKKDLQKLVGQKKLQMQGKGPAVKYFKP